MDFPLITIIVPAYNEEKYLSETISSLRKQDYPNFELVFIDNASGDGSEDFVRKNFPNVRVIQTGKNMGFAGGHNVGIRETDGEFILILNPDVVLRPDYLRLAIEPMLQDEKIAGVQGKLLRPSVSPIQHSNILEITLNSIENTSKPKKCRRC